jgi:hypothetical protein
LLRNHTKLLESVHAQAGETGSSLDLTEQQVVVVVVVVVVDSSPLSLHNERGKRFHYEFLSHLQNNLFITHPLIFEFIS